MLKSIVTTGKTYDLAVEAALAQLGLDRDSVSVELLAQAKPGFLGFGASPAKVQVTYEAPDIPEAPKVALSSASRSKPKKAAPVKQEEPKSAAPAKQEAPKAAAPKAEPKKEEAKAEKKQPKAEKKEEPKKDDKADKKADEKK